MRKKVFLTGISGFVGQHCAVELLKNGYQVKGSIRNLSKEQEVRNGISKVMEDLESLEFCQLDLLNDEGWEKAMEGFEYVLHVASPYFITEPKDENRLIKPALEGTRRVLNAAKKAGIKKVILTSSTAAMAGDVKKNHLTPESWTNPVTDKVSVYTKSKTLAERAAWEFYNSQDASDKVELTVINPGPIFGPTLTGNLTGASMSIIKDIIQGKKPFIPNIHYVMSDVRDVAKIHVDALENTESNGKRYLVSSERPYSFVSIASILKKNGYKKASPRQAPSFIVKFISLFNREVKGMLPFVDTLISADTSATQHTFHWEPIPFEKTIVDTAKSMDPYL